MLTSLYTGVSGINSQMSSMSVVGNNISNMNTYGFKSSRAAFGDILNNSMAGGMTDSMQIGLGVMMNQVSPNFSQGAFETTSNSFDMAIDGSGFFMVDDTSDGMRYYTRTGIYNMDKDGYVINAGGYRLQGYQPDSTGALTSSVDDLQVVSSSFPPSASTEITISANLDSDSTVIPAATGFLPASTDTTSNFQTTISVYDSLGKSHPVSICFRRDAVAPNTTWNWYAVTGASDHSTGAATTCAQGVMTFTTAGALDTVTTTANDFDFAGGPAANQAITFDFGSSVTTSGGTGLDGVTRFGSDSGVYTLSQDGYPSGSLQGISVDASGVLTGTFTNGQLRTLGAVTLANFAASNGLLATGNMLYQEMPASGAAVVGQPGGEGLGTIRSSTLEQSNVDLAAEFISMITAQRGFQANSKVITTTDEILMELVNLKR